MAQSVQRLATGWTAESSDFLVLAGSRIFTPPYRSDRLWGPSSLFPAGTEGFFFSTGINQPERESEHPLPANSGVKKTWIYTPTLSYAFMA
jgi:hypothetical protein